jgi:hypothetical protein
MPDYDDKSEPEGRFNVSNEYGSRNPEAPLYSFEEAIRQDKTLETFLENTDQSLETTCRWIDLLNDKREKLAESFRARALILNSLADQLDDKSNIFESFYDEALNEKSKSTRDMALAVASFAENTKNSEREGLASLRKAYHRLERAYELHNQLVAILDEYRNQQFL